MVAVCAAKYFTELFTPKPQAPDLLPTRSDLILEEFSKELPFDQMGSLSAGLVLQTAAAVVWG